MTGEPDNQTRRMLRHMDTKLDTIVGRLDDLTARVSSVENQRTDFVRLEHRVDRFDERLIRIERRLDLIEV